MRLIVAATCALVALVGCQAAPAEDTPTPSVAPSRNAVADVVAGEPSVDAAAGEPSADATASAEEVASTEEAASAVESASGDAALPGESPAAAEPQAAAGASGVLVFEGGETGTWDCGGADVEVKGTINSIVLTGACGKMTVWGNTNTIQADSIAVLEVHGEVNTITATTIEAFPACTGSVNTVTWESGVKAATVQTEGFVNTLTGP